MSLIDLKGISKTYKMGRVDVNALKNVDLKIAKGEYIAIMGPSGSGKSTLMNIIGCLDIPSKGKYHLDGVDISRLYDNELAKIRNKKVGFVFQVFNLLPRLNARKNVELPLIYAGFSKKDREARSIELLNKLGMGDRSHHKPTELSGGQRQKVAIARALANYPDIVLADEPTGNLDSRSGEEIMQIFDLLNKDNTTIILVTHERSIAERSRKILHLFDGEIENIENLK